MSSNEPDEPDDSNNTSVDASIMPPPQPPQLDAATTDLPADSALLSNINNTTSTSNTHCDNTTTITTKDATEIASSSFSVPPSESVVSLASFGSAAVAAAAALEAARCRATELEAWTHWCTAHIGNSASVSSRGTSRGARASAAAAAAAAAAVVDTAEFPPCVADAFQAMAQCSNSSAPNAATSATTTGTTTTATATNCAANTNNAHSSSPFHLPTSDPSSDRRVILPLGQQSVAVQTVCTAKALHRMAGLAADRVHHEQILLLPSSSAAATPNKNNNNNQNNSTTTTTTSTASSIFQHLKHEQERLLLLPESMPNHNLDSNHTNSTAAQWLQLWYERLAELRMYHAEHADTQDEIMTSLPLDPTNNALSYNHNHKRKLLMLHPNQQDGRSPSRWGNPALDGIDLAAQIHQWTASLHQDTELLPTVTTSSTTTPEADDWFSFTADEVMGKYLDMQESYEHVLRHLPHLVDKTVGQAQQLPLMKTNNNRDQISSNTISQTSFLSSASYSYVDFLKDLSKGMGSNGWKENNKLAKRKKYARWLRNLQDYLRSFLRRTIPLLEPETAIVQPADALFLECWSRTGGNEGWQAKDSEKILAQSLLDNQHPNPNTTTPTVTNTPTPPPTTTRIDLSKFESAEDLAAKVGGDSLKAELSMLGLKCGGTVQDRANRLFFLRGKTLAELPAKLFVAPKKRLLEPTRHIPDVATETPEIATEKPIDGAADNDGNALSHERRIDLARRENIVSAFLNQLGPTLEATIQRIERRQTQTLKEIEREVEEELYYRNSGGAGTRHRDDKRDGDDEEDEDEDAPIYNPKNVPLDFDGKPIPYWLFKLHGLNHYYSCEICNGEAYRGRRTFELHFGEQKHATGMRNLGIPNTKHFHGVTKIDDAQQLWKALQEKLEHDQFDGSREEEYEDSHGNVLSRMTYEDLARQGLL